MGGKRRNMKGLNATTGSRPHISMTLREESSGKKQGNVNAKTMCKLDHLKNIAMWALTEASVPALGAFLGERVAATTEALGLRTDSSLFVCERCESILQPGCNCTVRIEKNKQRHRRKRSTITTQNSVVYRCHFCSHQNSMRGTPKGYVKEIVKSAAEKHPSSIKVVTSVAEVNKADTTDVLPAVDGQYLETSSPATPLPPSGSSLLNSKRRKRTRSNAKKVAESETSLTAGDREKSKHGSTKRRKKSWTSLKEIAQNDISKKLTSLTIPFYI